MQRYRRPIYRSAVVLVILSAATLMGFSLRVGGKAGAAPAIGSGEPNLVEATRVEQRQAGSTAQDAYLVPNFFADIVERTLPSVVSVYVKYDLGARGRGRGRRGGRGGGPDIPPELRDFFENNQPNTPPPQDGPEARTSGSGVIISAEGHILTNNHIVRSVASGQLSILLHDDTEIPSDRIEILVADALLDLAILKVDPEGLNLTPIPWGDSDEMRIGDWVMAMGNPLDLRGTVSKGIVSAKGRRIGIAGIEHLIQTDAMINPGNSGGALVNMSGELIGINMAIATNTGFFQGIGFAIPSNDAHRIFDQVLAVGHIQRGYIGILMETLDDDAVREAMGLPPDAHGIIVMNVVADAPAEKAGIQLWDVISHVDGVPMREHPELLSLVSGKDIGDTARLSVLRVEDGEVRELNLRMQVMERPPASEEPVVRRKQERSSGDTREMQRSGLTVKPSDEGEREGLEIVEVRRNSPAQRAGLRAGFIIVEIDKEPVLTLGDLRRALAKTEGERPHLILYHDPREPLTVDGLAGMQRAGSGDR